MNYGEFLKAIKTGNIGNIYLFKGHEDYLMKDLVLRLKDKYIDQSLETLNYIEIDNRRSDFETILDACETLPFMSEKKIVVITDIMELIGNNGVDFEKNLNDYVTELGDHLIFIIMDKFDKLKKTTALYKRIKKLDGVVEFDSLRGAELNSWILNIIRKSGKDISNADLNYFIEKSSYTDYGSEKNLYDLKNEIEKAINNSPDDYIRKENIDSVMIRTLDTNIFNLLDSINRKDTDKALNIFNDMYISNEPVQRILFMIIRQVRLFLGFNTYRAMGYNDGEIRSKLKVKPYEYKKISNQARRFSKNELLYTLNQLLDFDIKQKTSSQDEKLAMEVLIVKLSM